MRAQADEETSQSGVQARYRMEQSYGKAVRLEIGALGRGRWLGTLQKE